MGVAVVVSCLSTSCPSLQEFLLDYKAFKETLSCWWDSLSANPLVTVMDVSLPSRYGNKSS